MNRKISLGVAIALMSLAAAVAIVITAGYSMYDFNGRMQSLRESEVMYSKLNEIDGYVSQNFYGDIDEEELMNAVAKGYVSGLGDKYARYMTPEEYQAQMEAYESQKASIGVSVVMDPSGYMKVIEVLDVYKRQTSGRTLCSRWRIQPPTCAAPVSPTAASPAAR